MYKRLVLNALATCPPRPILSLVGPRGSGKSTLIQEAFPEHPYLNLEDPSTRQRALVSPDEFLHAHRNQHGIIIDEFYLAPLLAQALKKILRQHTAPNSFVLVSSQQFFLDASLKDYTSPFTLLPFSLLELKSAAVLAPSIDTVIVAGGLPARYQTTINPQSFYPEHYQRCLERDLYPLVKANNHHCLLRFIHLCAARTGQLLNLESLAAHCGISAPTAKKWLQLLLNSFMVFLLPAYSPRPSANAAKTPKLYFFDTGLLCSLLQLNTAQDVLLSPLRSALFETLVISDLHKQFCQRGKAAPLYFWRNKGGTALVPCLLAGVKTLHALDINTAETVQSAAFHNLTRWHKLTKQEAANSLVIYPGENLQQRSTGTALGWKDFANLVDKLEALS